MSNKEIAKQTKLAFEYLQKLYLETSFFIKEVEGLLSKEKEEFIIGRPSGYGITTNRSAGLEVGNVDFWTLRKMAVFFVPRTATTQKGGQTTTKLANETKIIYLRIVLDGQGLSEPKVYAGILYAFVPKGKTSMEKIENLMSHIEYRETQVFKNPLVIDYIDGYLSFHGKLFVQNLFDLNSSQDVYNNIVMPVVELFRNG